MLEDVDFRRPRDLNRARFARLMTCRWVTEHQNLLLCGPTGIGNIYFASLANQAYRQGHSAMYVRLKKLLVNLMLGRGDGSYGKTLAKLARMTVLVIDVWPLPKLNDEGRRDLLEIFEDRHQAGSTIITIQLPRRLWNDSIEDPTLADAILNRLVHQANSLDLSGESLRKNDKLVLRYA